MGATASATGSRKAAAPDPVVLLDTAAGHARRLGRPDLAERLAAERKRLERPLCHVLVVGEFKKGKSSLINALLNIRACAVDADIATAVPTLVRYGGAATATLVTEPDGGHGTAEPERSRRRISLSAVQAFATERAAGAERGEAVHSVEVEVPRALLRAGIVLVDTPGVGGGLAAAHAAATLRALALADAVIFVTDAGQELSAPELDFLRQAATACPRIICALTKIDFYPEWRRIMELDRGHLERAGLECEIVPLSAPLRHYGIRNRDPRIDAESGYPRLSAYLRTKVLARLRSAAVRSAAEAMQSSMHQVLTRLATEHATLRDPDRSEGLLAQFEAARSRASLLRTGRWRQTLEDRFGSMALAADADLTTRLRRVRKEALDHIGASDPATAWSELQAWLGQRTTEELVGHYAWVRAEADTIADGVGELFDVEIHDLAIQLDPAARGAALRSVEVADLHFERLSGVQLGFVAARGSTSSVILTSMVGTFASFATFYAMPVTAVLALVLAAKAARAAKDTQLQANRAAAGRGIQSYLEDADLVARRDSRDTLQRLRGQLRDYFGHRADELTVSAGQNLEAAARAAKIGDQARQQQLQHTADEIKRLQAVLAAADRLAQAAGSA